MNVIKRHMTLDDICHCPSCGCGECTDVEDSWKDDAARKLMREALDACDKMLSKKYFFVKYSAKDGSCTLDIVPIEEK